MDAFNLLNIKRNFSKHTKSQIQIILYTTYYNRSIYIFSRLLLRNWLNNYKTIMLYKIYKNIYNKCYWSLI